MRIRKLLGQLAWGIEFVWTALASAFLAGLILIIAAGSSWSLFRDQTDVRTMAVILGSWEEVPDAANARPWPDESRRPSSRIMRLWYDFRLVQAQADRAIRHHVVLQIGDPAPQRLEFVGKAELGPAGKTIRVRYRRADPEGSLEIDRDETRNPDSLSDWQIVLIGMGMCGLLEWFLVHQLRGLWRDRPKWGGDAMTRESEP